MADVLENPGIDLFNKWAEYVKPIVGENYGYGVSAEIANNKKNYARLFVMGNTSGTMDLEGNEISTNLAVQCDSFSTESLAKAYEIDALSHQAMVNLGFHRTYGADITENALSSVKRITSRYRRVHTGYFNE